MSLTRKFASSARRTSVAYSAKPAPLEGLGGWNEKLSDDELRHLVALQLDVVVQQTFLLLRGHEKEVMAQALMVGETDTIVRASVTVFSNVATMVFVPPTIVVIPETKVFAKGTIFLIPGTMFPDLDTIIFISKTIVRDTQTMVGNTETMVGNTETIVCDTKTMFSDDH
jgi:hypothetical protein